MSIWEKAEKGHEGRMVKQYRFLRKTVSEKQDEKAQGELHLIILWANARRMQREILDDLNNTPALTLLECYDVQWTPQEVANNFTRFYGVKLDSGSFKEQECGTGGFLLITLRDLAPKYETAETSHGKESVNIRLFSLKQKYRQWTGGGHKVHGTTSPQETEHDLTLLLGVNSADYLAGAPSAWDGVIRPLKRDLSGAGGWTSFREFFYTLNATTSYVVLRGEEFFDGSSAENDTPGDIDIFTDDYDNLAYIVNGKAAINPHRPHYLTRIGEREYYMDIWDKRNEYYDAAWSRQMLETRELSQGGYYLPERNLRFCEFVYHCLIHKPKLTEKYHDAALTLFRESDFSSGIPEEGEAFPSFDLYFHLLLTFMRERSFCFVRPKDPTVFYHEQRTEDVPYFLESRGHCQLLSPYIVRGGGGFSYYTAFRDGVKIFVKCENKSSWGGGAKNEYAVSLKLSEANPEHFLRPLFFEEADSHCCIAFEFIEAPVLSSVLPTLSPEQKQDVVRQLEEIGKTLLEQKIAHRDIRPDNLILTAEGRLLLIDAQWAVSFDPYEELPKVAAHPAWFSDLGEEYKRAQYCWDDMWSLWQISLLLGCESRYCRECVGRCAIQFDVGAFIARVHQNDPEEAASTPAQNSLEAPAAETVGKPTDTKTNAASATNSKANPAHVGTYPRWLIRLLSCFIVKRRNRRHFRRKYAAPR